MSLKLAQWEKQYSSVVKRLQPQLLQRREFLGLLVKASITGVVASSSAMMTACHQPVISNSQLIIREPWSTFAAVQQHLFPSDGNGPGAAEINATHYLKFVLEAPDMDTEQGKLIGSGPQWINEIAKEQKGDIFVNLDSDNREYVINKVASSRVGENWLSYLLLYIFEALLTDPVYGANPDEIGWKWLQHKPGYPRPPRNKRYIDLI